MNLEQFHIEVNNPNWQEYQQFEINSDKPKELWQWQGEAFDKLCNARYANIQAYCGSGKSFLQVCLAIHQIVKSNHKQKQLIIVPQGHIAEGFARQSEYNYIKIKLKNVEYDWSIQYDHNFCNGKERISRLKKWLLTPKEILSKFCSENVISGLNAVCSYSALILAWKEMSSQEKEQSRENLTLRIDEFHHAKNIMSGDEELSDELIDILEEEATEIGRIATYFLNGCTTCGIHTTTATDFRGDGAYILTKEARKKFVEYKLDWIEHFNSLGIEKFDLSYEEYDKNPISTIINNIKKEPNEKHLIVIPSTTHKWRLDRKSELQELVKELVKIYPKERILDLVSLSTQFKNKRLLLSEPKTSDKKSKFDVVIMCMLGREGTDWCPCSRLHNAACESSITLAIQTMGRLFRKFEGKTNIKIRHYVRRFVKISNNVNKLELLTDRTNAILVCMQLDDMSSPILIPSLPNQDNKKYKHQQKQIYISLPNTFGEQWINAQINLYNKYEMMENRSAENIKKLINEILDDYGIVENKENVIDGLAVKLLRASRPEFRMKGIDVSFLRKNGYGLLEQDGSIYFRSLNKDEWSVLRKRFTNSSEENKKKLLEMARAGKDRPKQNKDPLGEFLCKYTNVSNDCYDYKFNKEIRELAPHWFIDRKAENKKKILEIAKNGYPKPKNNLRYCIYSYTNTKSQYYDEKFDKELKSIVPNWFINTSYENKKKILEIARQNTKKDILKEYNLLKDLHRYICKASECYDEEFDKQIKILRPDWFINPSDDKKKQLIEMAMNGEEKPKQGKHPLGKSLSDYTYNRKSDTGYDKKFNKLIRKLAPHWFITKSDIANSKKDQLLDMAKKGESKPSKIDHPLGLSLITYTSKTSGCYDQDFDKKIRELAPHWFINFKEIVKENKRILLEMAKNKEKRPISGKHKLGRIVTGYTSKTSTSYDAEFDKKVREIAPHWFVKPKDSSDIKKRQIIEIAKEGKTKPTYNSLGQFIGLYTRKNSECYDKEFDIEIKKLAPQWFINSALENKKILLKMAMKGEKRPYCKYKIGLALCSYTNKNNGSYDEEFDKKIRDLVPEWFVSTSNLKKKRLLEMARRGDNRPIEEKDELGITLGTYIRKSSGCYDAEFDQEIRLLAPQWFVSASDNNKKKLIEMAKNNEPRPKVKKHPLGNTLIKYTSKKYEYYDEEFDIEIRKLAPHWFEKRRK